MDSLQKQMEEHTVTVSSLASAEEELQKLGLHDDISNDLSNKEENDEIPGEMQPS